ncbi:MAG: vWA domain-containing protein [Myxococcota bacterium]
MQHLEIDGRFDRPQVLVASPEQEVKFLLSLRPGHELQRLEGGAEVGTNVCLLFDVSQSMEEDDKLEAAIAAGRELIELADAKDTLSIVAFDDETYSLASCLAAEHKPQLFAALESLRSVGGGMTNMAAGLSGATEQVLRTHNDGQARAIILLSDGEDNYCKPDVLHEAVRATDNDIQLFAIGVGADYDAKFLKALVTPSNGTLFGDTDVEKVKEAFIDLAVTLANVVATQTTLELRFHDAILVGKGYKASPDQFFLGNTRLERGRTARRRVGNIERNKEYAFLFELIVPGQPPSASATITATVSCDIPALGLRGVTATETFTIHYTQDAAVADKRDGAVLECYRRVQITELVERFVEAHQAGHAEKTARYLELLIQKYSDVNDLKMVNHYESIRADLLKGGQITRAMLNASVVASTVVQGGGELPVLIDDSF